MPEIDVTVDEVVQDSTSTTLVPAPRAKINLPANIRAQLQAEVQDIAKRIGAPSGNRIKVTQKKTFRLPTGEESAGPIRAVILDFVAANYLYTGPYDPEDISPPACFAIGKEISSMAPHADVLEEFKGADACAVCPNNQFGSAQRGKGKACSNCRVLALLPVDATADSPIMTLRISPTAIRLFDGYVGGIARSFGVPPIGVVTSIGFDPAEDYASVRFGDPEPISEELFTLAMSRREEAQRIISTPPDTTSLKVVEVVKDTKPAAGARRGRI